MSHKEHSDVPRTLLERLFGRNKSEDASGMNSITESSRKSSFEAAPSAASVAKALSPNVGKYMYPRVKRNPPGALLLQIGEQLKDRWLIKGLIGRGGYGQIYYAADKEGSEGVAVKAEPTKRRGKTSRRMILEQRVLLRLQGRPHAPLMYASGVEREKDINYIVMQLLSVNVSELRKRSHLKRLSVNTTARIMQQLKTILFSAIAALRDVHHIGYLHRDVKPSNMCFGVTDASKHRLILVDFGLARRYKTDEGKVRAKRSQAGICGTPRYVSSRVHDGEEQGPSDDLVALLYSAIELIRGKLSWKHVKPNKEIKDAKDEMKNDELRTISEGIGKPFQEFGKAVLAMTADDEPNYSELQDFMKMLADGKQLNDPYDWENDFVDVHAEKDLNKLLRLNG
ncbi:hypothetical protein L596_016206 [Steinernema carpocapsae]|uniref:non-specific serine/threonine protein kinase n=1 Tax=Steinernema carpocapsae TaxID=34508 RepID=A0A4U5NI29_STECR|nr:hypothetical protein L596_016206 [Steinernema carpocapsae]